MGVASGCSLPIMSFPLGNATVVRDSLGALCHTLNVFTHSREVTAKYGHKTKFHFLHQSLELNNEIQSSHVSFSVL